MVEEVRHELQEFKESIQQTRTMVRDLQQASNKLGTENKQSQRRMEKLEKSVKMLDQVQKDQLGDETRQRQQEFDRQGDGNDKKRRWSESLETKRDLLEPRSVQPASQGQGPNPAQQGAQELKEAIS